MKKSVSLGVAMAASVSLLAACGQAPSSSPASSTPAASDAASSSAPAASSPAAGVVEGFLPCIVSDAGGFDDRSFNQASFEGLKEAADGLGIEMKSVQSDSEDQYAGNISSLIDQGCSLIVSVGFALADATKTAAEANPDVQFVMLDDSSIELDNVKPVIYDTAQAAFLAGYAAASYSKTGTVATWGGMPYPTVTIFMDGFADGVEFFNSENGKDVKVIGWDVASQEGSFTGGFEANNQAKEIANTMISQGADVLLPVGGPIFMSAIEAVNDSGKEIALVGVDADLYETADSGNALFLTSILKQMKSGVSDIVSEAATGTFDPVPYVGTLSNDGVGIAPFHDFESKVDPALAGQLDTIKKGIIDGDITVTSPSSPGATN